MNSVGNNGRGNSVEVMDSRAYTAWVITWWHHTDVPWPDVAMDRPLAVLPSDTHRDHVEVAMIAVHQLVCQSSPARLAEVLKSTNYQVEWYGAVASIGHEPKVFAEIADVTHWPDPAANDRISFVRRRET